MHRRIEIDGPALSVSSFNSYSILLLQSSTSSSTIPSLLLDVILKVRRWPSISGQSYSCDRKKLTFLFPFLIFRSSAQRPPTRKRSTGPRSRLATLYVQLNQGLRPFPNFSDRSDSFPSLLLSSLPHSLPFTQQILSPTASGSLPIGSVQEAKQACLSGIQTSFSTAGNERLGELGREVGGLGV